MFAPSLPGPPCFFPLVTWHASQFCCPEGIKCISSFNPKATTHSHSSFVLTDANGGASYGYALQFFEPLPNLPSEWPPSRDFPARFPKMTWFHGPD